MVTCNSPNVKVIGVDSDFDFCQTSIKKIFNDEEFVKKLEQDGWKLSAANSINWGRLLSQIVYHFYGYLQVPTCIIWFDTSIIHHLSIYPSIHAINTLISSSVPIIKQFVSLPSIFHIHKTSWYGMAQFSLEKWSIVRFHLAILEIFYRPSMLRWWDYLSENWYALPTIITSSQVLYSILFILFCSFLSTTWYGNSLLLLSSLFLFFRFLADGNIRYPRKISQENLFPFHRYPQIFQPGADAVSSPIQITSSTTGNCRNYNLPIFPTVR